MSAICLIQGGELRFKLAYVTMHILVSFGDNLVNKLRCFKGYCEFQILTLLKQFTENILRFQLGQISLSAVEPLFEGRRKINNKISPLIDIHIPYI